MSTLNELGMEYVQQSKIVLKMKNELIRKLSNTNYHEGEKLKERIAMLEEMADDCRRTGELLMAYYR